MSLFDSRPRNKQLTKINMMFWFAYLQIIFIYKQKYVMQANVCVSEE